MSPLAGLACIGPRVPVGRPDLPASRVLTEAVLEARGATAVARAPRVLAPPAHRLAPVAGEGPRLEGALRSPVEAPRAFEAARAGSCEAGAEPRSRTEDAAVLDVDGAASNLLALAGAALRADAVGAWLLSRDGAELRLWAGRRREGEEHLPEVLSPRDGPLASVLSHRVALRLGGRADRSRGRARALLAVPLLAPGSRGVRGLVVADRAGGDPFDEEEERLLRMAAAELTRCATAARVVGEAQVRRTESDRVFRVIERLNRTTTPRDVLDTLLRAASDIAEMDLGVVTLVERRAGSVRHRVARVRLGEVGERGADLARVAGALDGREFPDNGGLVACAAKLGATLPARELDLSTAVVFDASTRLPGIQVVKVVPLRAAEDVLGTIVLGTHGRGFGADAVRQLELLALQGAEALLRARLFEETQRLATMDGLTGLANRRTFEARLGEHLATAQRYGRRVSLLLLDIDHFKQVNDVHGHLAGDAVLRGVAGVLLKEARATDLAARYGGEELALVMPETDAAGAMRTAERVRRAVESARFAGKGGPIAVTLSVGVATFPHEASSAADLVALADAGLYFAKRAGRNRSVAGAEPCGGRGAGSAGAPGGIRGAAGVRRTLHG